MKVEMNIQGLEGVLDLLKSLPAEIVSKNGGPVKAALKDGALVIHKEAISRLDVVVSNQTTDDDKANTGLLQKNVIVSRGKQPFGSKGERYLVRVRRKTYNRKAEQNAKGRKAKKEAAVTTLKTAQLLEYGSSQQQKEPWLRPAFLTKAEEAIKVTTESLIKRLDKVVKKLSRNKGKK